MLVTAPLGPGPGLVTTIWTPVFVAIFLAIIAYAFWPRNKAAFDEAASLPLREE